MEFSGFFRPHDVEASKNLNHTQGQTIQPLTATPLPNLHSMSSHQNHSYGLTSISEMEAAFDTEEQESDGYLATSNDDYSESFGNKIGDKNYSELFLNLQSNQSPGDSFPTSPNLYQLYHHPSILDIQQLVLKILSV